MTGIKSALGIVLMALLMFVGALFVLPFYLIVLWLKKE